MVAWPEKPISLGKLLLWILSLLKIYESEEGFIELEEGSGFAVKFAELGARNSRFGGLLLGVLWVLVIVERNLRGSLLVLWLSFFYVWVFGFLGF